MKVSKPLVFPNNAIELPLVGSNVQARSSHGASPTVERPRRVLSVLNPDSFPQDEGKWRCGLESGCQVSYDSINSVAKSLWSEQWSTRGRRWLSASSSIAWSVRQISILFGQRDIDKPRQKAVGLHSSSPLCSSAVSAQWLSRRLHSRYPRRNCSRTLGDDAADKPRMRDGPLACSFGRIHASSSTVIK
jgi:hypothetical protein